MLDENAGSIGVLLWDAARDVVLWSTSAREELSELFAPAAERMRMTSVLTTMLDRKLETALQALARMVGRPALANRERASMACREISQWADTQGAIATAYAFAHAAAMCCPGNARLSQEAGRIARRRADYGTAEAWLGRAVLLGRQTRDYHSCVDAHGGLGNLHVQRGNYPRAKRYHAKALRLAQTIGARQLQGKALHALLGIAANTGAFEDALRYGRQAFETLPSNDPSLPVLAHDLAYVWLEQGYYRSALQVFTAVLPTLPASAHVSVRADIARSAAGLGDDELYENSWESAIEALDRGPVGEYHSQALFDLGIAAATRHQWSRADIVLNRAVEVASLRKEARVMFAAESKLEEVRQLRNSQHTVAPVTCEWNAEVDELAGSVAGSLMLCTAAA